MQMRFNRRQPGTSQAPRRSPSPRLRAATLFSCLIALLGMGASSAQAAFPGENGRIAFQRTVECAGPSFSLFYEDIVTLAPDGSSGDVRFRNSPCPTPGDPLPQSNRTPSHSPDGKKIVFFRGGVTQGDIWLANADGSGEEQLTFGQTDSRPAFSPDGTRLIFLRTAFETGNKVVTMKVTGSDPKRVTPATFTGTEFTPVYSPDGSKIAFSLGGSDIYTVNVDGTGLTALTNDAVSFAADSAPDFSPDGTKITFRRRDGTGQHIWSMSAADGSNPVPLTETGLNEAPAFSPDGTQIAFQSDRSNPGCRCFEIFSMNADGSDETRLTTTTTFLSGTGDQFPDWGQRPRPATVPPVVVPPRIVPPVVVPPRIVPPAGSSAFAGCPVLTANVIRGSAASNTITGTPAADRIFAGTGNDVVDGLPGNDCVDLGEGFDRGQGGLGDDYLLGALGNDTISGSPGNDRVNGDAGNDRVAGDTGNDRVLGGAGRDVLSGGSGSDALLGGQGNDRLSGGSQRDRISGGAGDDRISSSGDRARDTVSCGPGRDTVVAGRTDRVARDCERVVRRGR